MKDLRISVKSLVKHALRAGDLLLDVWEPKVNLEGIRAHQRIQKSRPDEYSSEVRVSRQFLKGDFKVEIQGRIDGVFQYPDQTIIEEIKTTAQSLDQLETHQGHLHWGQAKVYAYLYCEDHALDEVDVQVTYFDVETGETRERIDRFTRSELVSFFDAALDTYVGWQTAVEDWIELRNNSIRDTAFPFSSYRPGQRELAVRVYRAIAKNNQLLAQAPTGIGKTIASIFPAIKAMAEGFTDRIFYLTARTTGKTAAEKAIEILNDAGLRLKSVTLTAKDKICFNPDRACNGEECDFARGYYDRVGGALEDFLNTDRLDRGGVEELARRHRLCPFELSLEIALWADLVIGDYNYGFDPRVSLRRLLEEGGEYTFIIDEAHNLVDRSREMFSAELEKRPLMRIRRALKNSHPNLWRALGRVDSQLRKLNLLCKEAGGSVTLDEAPINLEKPLTRFVRETQRSLSSRTGTPIKAKEELLDQYFACYRFLNVFEQFDDNYATCLFPDGTDLKLRLYCMDPSPQLKQILKRSRAAILLSATLVPIRYFREILGCSDAAGEFVLPSPFPRRNVCSMLCDSVSTLYRDREETREEVAQLLHTFVSQRVGNYLLFFPSYEYLEMVLDCFFRLDTSGLEIILQKPQMPEEHRDQFLKTFSENRKKTLAGFVVMGGAFGEAIDLGGNRLTGAAIVGVGLPGVSLERELIREYFTKSRNSGFDFSYRYPGISRVLQAAGRVIRSETDRGSILLIDRRFSQGLYRQLLPREWSPTLVRTGDDVKKTLQRFWESDWEGSRKN
jgi:DNA excision repair protein ERCC-2